MQYMTVRHLSILTAGQVKAKKNSTGGAMPSSAKVDSTSERIREITIKFVAIDPIVRTIWLVGTNEPADKLLVTSCTVPV